MALPKNDSLIVKLVEHLRGTNALNLYNKYKKSDLMSIKDINENKIKKLNILFNSIFKNNQFYKKHWKLNDLNQFKISSLSELEKIPILTKNHLKNSYDDLIHKNIMNMQYEKAFSGGTTGDPVKVLMDRNSRSHSTAAIMRYFNWWGCEIGQKTVVLWGRQFSSDIGKFGKIKTDIHRLLTKKLYLNTFMLNDNILLEHYKSFHAYNPYILRGYANSVYLFAQFIYNQKLEIPDNLRLISCTSEKLTNEMKIFIEKVFNVAVTNQYGFGEINSVAFECRKGRNMHIVDEHVHVEALDENDQVVYDEPGRLVVTDLDNFTMPLIRYEVGDIGVISKQKCICGRHNNVLKEVTGRLSNALVLANGNKIAPSYWSVLLRPYRSIIQSCINVIDGRHIEVYLSLSTNNDFLDIPYLKSSINKILGEKITFSIIQVTDVPKPKSGKAVWVIYNNEKISKNHPLFIKKL
tara:strand:- start:18631 stop:20022 length:1392 start_codon:yes stop_codon:yes gene_type:complete